MNLKGGVKSNHREGENPAAAHQHAREITSQIQQLPINTPGKLPHRSSRCPSTRPGNDLTDPAAAHQHAREMTSQIPDERTRAAG